MDIVLSWDPSVAALPAGEQAAFEAAVSYAASYWDATLTNNLTIDINVGWGEITQNGQTTTLPAGTSEGGPDDGSTYPYAQVRAALQAHENSPATASAYGALPATDPTNGMGITIPVVQAEALGLPPDNGGATALGSIGFGQPGPGWSYNFSTTDRAIPNEADLVGIALHELSHALGRTSTAGADQPPTVMDLFRFTAPGVENPAAGEGSYFSVDNGATALQYWAGPSSDPGDWSDKSPLSSINDSFDVSYVVGVENDVTSPDLTLMNVLGYRLASTTTAATAAASDFNGDGLSDILWRNTASGDVSLWLTSASGGHGEIDLGAPDLSWAIQSIGDLNGDGKADILWRNANGDLGEWLSHPGAGFTGFDELNLGPIATNWVIQGAGDFSRAGLADILWRNSSNGDVSLWLTSASGGHAEIDLGQPDQSWVIQSVCDLNGDGKADILWRNTNGDLGEWLSHPGAGFTGFDELNLGPIATNWVIQGAGDFSGGGLADILWRNANNGDVSLWLVSPSGGHAEIDLGVIDSSWSIQGVADINGDGKADIVWRNTNGDLGEWLSNPGAGFTGFNELNLGPIDNNWQIASPHPPAHASGNGAARFAQATAALTGPSAQALNAQVTHPLFAQPMLAAPNAA